MKSIEISGAKLLLAKGDIALEESDAIVNAANNVLWMGSGVAGAIKKEGGQEIEEEAVSKGPIEIGEAILTGSGNLKSKCVIHAAVMGQDLSTDADTVKKALISSFDLAEQEGLNSISVPALGTGVGGFSIDACAEIMVRVTINFLQRSVNIKLVKIVLFSDSDLETFEGKLEEIFSRK